MSILQNNLDEILAEKEAKILPENIKKGVKIFDIEGTLESGGGSGDVKLFSSVDEMNTDTNKNDGDLAVVYHGAMVNMTKSSVLKTINFPETVTLDVAITSSSSGRYYDDNREYQYVFYLAQKSFYIRDYYGGAGYIVRYTSADGITYTRSTTTESYTFEVPIKYDSGTWKDEYCRFVKVFGNVFDGLFEYGPYTDIENIGASPVTNFSVVNEEITQTAFDMEPLNIFDVHQCIDGIVNRPTSSYYLHTIYRKDGVYYFLNSLTTNYSPNHGIFLDGGDWWYISNASAVINIDEYILDLTNKTATKNKTYVTPGTGNNFSLGISSDILPIRVYATKENIYIGPENADNCQIQLYAHDNNVTFLDVKPIYYIDNKYQHAPSQLTLNNANQLLPGQTAYGSNGVITGDGSIYNNLDKTYILENIFGLTKLGSYYIADPSISVFCPSTLSLESAKLHYLKLTDEYNEDCIYTMTNESYIGRTKGSSMTDTVYLGKDGQYIATSGTTCDIIRLNDLSTVTSITISVLIGYYNGYLIYTKSELSPTSSITLYKYDISSQTEVELGTTPTISNRSWSYSYSYYHILGNVLIYNCNGELSNSRIGASVRLFNLDTGATKDLPSIDVSTTYSIGYEISPFLNTDNTITIYQQSHKSGTETDIWYMYIYDITTNTLTTVASGTTVKLIGGTPSYMFKSGYCVLDDYAYLMIGQTLNRINLKSPTAMETCNLADGNETINIAQCKMSNVPYTVSNDRIKLIDNIIYNNDTNTLQIVFGDVLPFYNNCKLYMLSDSGTNAESSALPKFRNIIYDETNHEYTLDIGEYCVVGKDIHITAYKVSTSADYDICAINGDTTATNNRPAITLFDKHITDVFANTISPVEYDTALDTATEILGEEV